MNTTKNTTTAAPVADSEGRRCYTYIIAVSGRLWSLCVSEWWGTPDEMRTNAASMATAARIFRHSAAVAVYELRNDDYLYFVHGCELPGTNDAPASFHRYNMPVIRRNCANK